MSMALRKAMIDSQLRPQGVSDRRVLDAFLSVPREEYLPENVRALAYRDRSVPLGDGRSMPAAAALASLIQSLDARPGMSALAIGPGAAYAAALLAHMGLKVVALDEKKLSGPTPEGATYRTGNPAEGHADAGPYDRILILGAVEELTDAICGQLADGGRLATGRFDRGVTRLAAGGRVDGRVKLDDFADAQLPLIEQFARKPQFVF
ncbi:protein-L-isoaspartate O-methyltransferase family protein [Sphingomicrobium lutaoense]|uniref:Protein-L-isoaspartate O-methyltransferase n=1 Tax=Sphingomicrobium lutaoense TaxID=515949 RepID=A0A839YW61_9SPHN|nr:protein-L-isoaspartate O-methyltransferase [Sphingomicrobium lutaoense]MBB3763266.1 protein-L-isoaspartate(D-aspartate) O-methyltransferase [Sphingomicrobium lutaoense]